MSLLPGTLIDNKFELRSLLGSGGFGDAYSAKQIGLDRLVVIKVQRQPCENFESNRFLLEAKALNCIEHQNVAAIYGYGVWQDRPYLAMEYVEGSTLDALISERGNLSLSWILEVFEQLAQGLASCHSKGVLHRDIKPQNIIISTDNDGRSVAKLVDFGLAKLLPGSGVEPQKLTATGVVVGSLHYMAPEICRGEPAVAATDIYALGCVMYECLTGQVPFDADDPIPLMMMHIHSKTPCIEADSQQTQHLELIQDLIDSSMQKMVANRIQTADEFAGFLNKIKQACKTDPKLLAATFANSKKSGERSTLAISETTDLLLAKRRKKIWWITGPLGLAAVLLALPWPSFCHSFLKTINAPNTVLLHSLCLISEHAPNKNGLLEVEYDIHKALQNQLPQESEFYTQVTENLMTEYTSAGLHAEAQDRFEEARLALSKAAEPGKDSSDVLQRLRKNLAHLETFGLQALEQPSEKRE